MKNTTLKDMALKNTVPSESYDGRPPEHCQPSPL